MSAQNDMDEPYKNREIDEKFGDIMDSLGRIEEQTTRHNGRLTRLEKITWIVGTAIVVLAVSGNAKLVSILQMML